MKIKFFIDGIVDVELKRIDSIDIDTLNIIDNTATSPIDPHPFDPNDDYGNESYSDEVICVYSTYRNLLWFLSF